jgi:two-component system cell cycle sensor histidine kinase/response regulator CckA
MRMEGVARLREIARSGSDLRLVDVARFAGIRVVAFAASPRAGSDLVVYGEVTAPGAEGQSGGVQASGLRFAIYAGREATPQALILSSPGGAPDGSAPVTDVLRIGDEDLLVTLEPRGSLVRKFTRSTPWLILAIGLLGTLAVAALAEATRRRRDKALVLVEALEKRTAELDRALAQQRRAEQLARASQDRLAEAEETYRTLVERLPLVTYINRLGEQASPIYVSPQLEKLLGYSVDEWLADADFLGKLLHPEDRDQVLADLERRSTGETDYEPVTEYRLIARDGRVLWVYGDAVTVLDQESRPIYMQGFLLDITESKRLEDELRQAQKMEAVGRLAGGIAHDFNNILTVIASSAHFLLNDLDEGDPRRDDAQQIAKAGERAAALTQQLLAFSRRQVLQPELLDLNKVVRDMQQLLERVIGEHIELVTVLEPELGSVRADRGQLEQVILNLAVNARDAMPTGGLLSIETENGEHDVTGQPGQADGRFGSHVALIVSDTGHGMDESARANAFEPFFTTKAKGKGTGLGLATVYGIVIQSGGSISIESELRRGTRVRIELPRADVEELASTPPRDQANDAVRGSNELVLLAEDDAHVREMVRRVLAENGYLTLVARSPTEAIALSERHRGEIDLLLTDVVMPEMSGRDLAGELAPTQPAMQTLFMSGYTDDAIIHHGVLEDGIAFIEKPFTPRALVRKVREVLAAYPSGATAGGSERDGAI